jgi:hypothetical protein
MARHFSADLTVTFQLQIFSFDPNGVFPRLFANDVANVNSRQSEWHSFNRLHGGNHERLAQTLFEQGASLKLSIVAHVRRYSDELYGLASLHLSILVRGARP